MQPLLILCKFCKYRVINSDNVWLLVIYGFDRSVKLLVVYACYDDVLPDKDSEKQKILEELSAIYHSTIEPLESLYQYNVFGVGSFIGTLQYFSEYDNDLFIM